MDNTRSDQQLIRATIHGQWTAFEELIRRHQNGIYQYVLSYIRDPEEAQDLVQETFLSAFEGISTLCQPDRFAGWLRSIARNTCLNALRSRRRRDAAIDRLKEDVLGSIPQSSSSRLEDDHASFIRILLAELPAKSAQAVFMHYVDGVSVAAIAQRLDSSPQAVKQRLYRARRQLQEEVLAMMKDTVQKEHLPEGFERRIIARLLESGREHRLHMEYTRSIQQFQEAMNVAPDDPEVLVEFGSTYDLVGWPDQEQVEALERARDLAPPDSTEALRALYKLSIVYGRYKPEAQEATCRTCMALCDRRLARDSKDITSLKCRAQLLRIVDQDYGSSELLWRTVTEETPEDQEGWFFLARTIGSQERYEEAVPLYEKILEMDPKTEWAFCTVRQLAVHYAFRVGDGTQAVARMKQAYALHQTPAEAGNLIYFYSTTGQLREAIDLFESLDDAPHPPRVLVTVGIGYWKRGDLVNARKALESAIEQTRDDGLRAEAQLHLSAVFFALGPCEEAKSVLEDGLGLDVGARRGLAGGRTSAFWDPWTTWLTETLEELAQRNPQAKELLSAVKQETLGIST